MCNRVFQFTFSWTWPWKMADWLWTNRNLVSLKILILSTDINLLNLDFKFCFLPLSVDNSNDNAGAKLLKQLSKINRPLEIKFNEMLNLMNQCDIVEKQNQKRIENRSTDKSRKDDTNTFQFSTNPFSLFSGILPGTFYFSYQYSLNLPKHRIINSKL